MSKIVQSTLKAINLVKVEGEITFLISLIRSIPARANDITPWQTIKMGRKNSPVFHIGRKKTGLDLQLKWYGRFFKVHSVVDLATEWILRRCLPCTPSFHAVTLLGQHWVTWLSWVLARQADQVSEWSNNWILFSIDLSVVQHNLTHNSWKLIVNNGHWNSATSAFLSFHR